MKWPLPHWQMAIVSLVLGLLAYFAYANQGLRHERDGLQKTNGELSQSLRIQSDLQIRASAIDTHRTRELADAKSKIADLQRDVANGVKRLQLNASCKSASATTAGSVADGTSARLTDSAERDYFTLRERIETARSQIDGLQDYINDVCLAK
ncbi:lysis protein [Serratia sp. JSRIV004]|uniref:lysis protein n=1 Tax=Serratia sp. JSRIV004 TaxID=2831895 RepID=UPI001FDA38FF|nr:lysis protein [Serratia sp. JSRIV004]UAN59007.1 lysis protein [Serratia sp. JSRIV004]UAN59634.1 lysis protein [Serratia sp. JSRIV004]